jgi:hypothetical protein
VEAAIDDNPPQPLDAVLMQILEEGTVEAVKQVARHCWERGEVWPPQQMCIWCVKSML